MRLPLANSNIQDNPIMSALIKVRSAPCVYPSIMPVEVIKVVFLVEASY